jgi:hypothetical protein
MGCPLENSFRADSEGATLFIMADVIIIKEERPFEAAPLENHCSWQCRRRLPLNDESPRVVVSPKSVIRW